MRIIIRVLMVDRFRLVMCWKAKKVTSCKSSTSTMMTRRIRIIKTQRRMPQIIHKKDQEMLRKIVMMTKKGCRPKSWKRCARAISRT